MSGEVILVFPDGTETYLKNPGDTVVQRGTNHAWKNPGTTWTRWVTFVIDAIPARVDGKELPELLSSRWSAKNGHPVPDAGLK